MEYLFRSEDMSCGERDPKEVIRYETCVLGNTDIWEYCLEHYELEENTKQLIADVIQLSEDGEPCDESVVVAIDALLEDLKRQFGREIKYCLWLTDFQHVMEYYGEPTTKCQVSDVILSDLGSDGILYGYFDKPNEIEINGYKFCAPRYI